MMKSKLILILMLAIVACLPARADIIINDITYRADTMVHRQVGPGMVNTIVHLPDYPLNVYVL